MARGVERGRRGGGDQEREHVSEPPNDGMGVGGCQCTRSYVVGEAWGWVGVIHSTVGQRGGQDGGEIREKAQLPGQPKAKQFCVEKPSCLRVKLLAPVGVVPDEAARGLAEALDTRAREPE